MWGGYAPPDPPLKSAAVAASASQIRTLKPSRPLSRPPGVRSTGEVPCQGLARKLWPAREWQGGPGLAHTLFFLTKTNLFIFSGGSPAPPAQQEKAGLFCISWKCDEQLAEKSSGMGPRKKFRNLQAWLGVPGQVWPRPDFQVGPKTSKMVRNRSRIDRLA